MEKELDPNDFRAPIETDIDALWKRSSRRPPRHQKGEKFLKGPIPWKWLQRAMKLKGKALHVAILLWREAGMTRTSTIRFNLSAQAKNGVLLDAARNGLRALESAKLVTVTHYAGQALEVTLLETPIETPEG
jgi:choline dehydrogenase-like flavoprotein